MAKGEWSQVNRTDVLKAIKLFQEEMPEYPESKFTFLIYEGQRLPAKHIRGMAYAVHFGKEISKEDYTGGMETVRFFERLGFQTEYKGMIIGTGNKIEEQKPIKTKDFVKKETNLPVVTPPKTNETVATDKLRIPTKGVTEQKNALQLLLNKLFDGDIVCEKTYPWLKTPDKIEGIYKKVFQALEAYRGDSSFAKKNVALRCDFICESKKLIIEYDERQHFSEARRCALESYPEIPVLYNRELWIQACKDVNAKDNYPANRDEIRAYYDSIRDILCYENGYRLMRIMHGQNDFSAPDAEQQLKNLLADILSSEPEDVSITSSEIGQEKIATEPIKQDSIRIALYLQTNELKNKKAFDRALPRMINSKADILVFPENCYVPFEEKLTNTDILLNDDSTQIREECLRFSREINKAVIVSSHDKYDTIYSIYANDRAVGDETKFAFYIKHTMCGSSCLEFNNYPEIAKYFFEPIYLGNFQIGMTICYDCNHALFSRMYGMYGIDLIINSTGGDVVYEKWHKYNKARAIENNCSTLVTMGGDGTVKNSHNYVLGFNPNGGRLIPKNLKDNGNEYNTPGGLYEYVITKEAGNAEEDYSNQTETENKSWQLELPVQGSSEYLSTAEKITENIYRKKIQDKNVFFLLVDGMDILKPERVQPLLYADEIKKYFNRKYVIINRHKGKIDPQLFKDKLSLIGKVRAMENYCCVVVESENINKCYQTGNNRTAQVVKATDGKFRIDLSRTTGPEAIWKNKPGMKAAWRKNYEWLVKNSETLYQEEAPKDKPKLIKKSK